MTQDEIISMAIQAGLAFDSEEYPEIWGVYMDVGREEIVSFAKLVAEKTTEEANARANASWALMCEKMVAFEREACAKLTDEYATWGGSNFYDWFKKLATAIREGEQHT